MSMNLAAQFYFLFFLDPSLSGKTLDKRPRPQEPYERRIEQPTSWYYTKRATIRPNSHGQQTQYLSEQ
jgi:hypothetical protein